MMSHTLRHLPDAAPDQGIVDTWRDRHPVWRILVDARLLGPGIVLALVLPAALALAGRWLGGTDPTTASASAMLTLLMLGTMALGLGAKRLLARLIRPLVELEGAVARVCQGQPGANLEADKRGVLAPLAVDIDSLSEELTELYEDMDTRVARQTARLAQKTASLKILYDVAATINQTHTLDEVLLRFLRVLKEMVNGLSATARLITPEDGTRLVGGIDLDNRLRRFDQALPVSLCTCGKALVPGDILCESPTGHCTRHQGRQMFGTAHIDRIRVPLEHHGELFGVYELFVRKPGVAGREDIKELLATVGHHLGMAVAKQRSDDEAHRLSIIEERTNLAHELHDSLAQTLASLRFQVRMLEETLVQAAAGESARREVERIRNSLDEAHRELRELLNSFRAPLDRGGLVPALEQVVQRFKDDTGIATFFQRDCRQVELSASEQLQLVRIVQEALANVRKHAQAQTVRVLLRCRSPGCYALLVEDDGVGFANPTKTGHPGEHVGLSIMRQRAQRLGARLLVESEPGEGTRVELGFRAGGRSRGNGLDTGEGTCGYC
jgi:two-component system, NarL family, nitrate/nitrite sensor histidine kinase NarX